MTSAARRPTRTGGHYVIPPPVLAKSVLARSPSRSEQSAALRERMPIPPMALGFVWNVCHPPHRETDGGQIRDCLSDQMGTFAFVDGRACQFLCCLRRDHDFATRLTRLHEPTRQWHVGAPACWAVRQDAADGLDRHMPPEHGFTHVVPKLPRCGSAFPSAHPILDAPGSEIAPSRAATHLCAERKGSPRLFDCEVNFKHATRSLAWRRACAVPPPLQRTLGSPAPVPPTQRR